MEVVQTYKLIYAKYFVKFGRIGFTFIVYNPLRRGVPKISVCSCISIHPSTAPSFGFIPHPQCDGGTIVKSADTLQLK